LIPNPLKLLKSVDNPIPLNAITKRMVASLIFKGLNFFKWEYRIKKQ